MVRAAAAAFALVFTLPATGAVPRRAALQLESAATLVVSGRHFGARETVLLTYVGDETSRAAGVRATRTGSFRVTFPIRVGRCDSFTVRAVGVHGSRAVLQVERVCGRTKGPPEQPSSVR